MANSSAGADTIELAADGIYTLSAVHSNNFWNGPNGLPFIISQITINGNGATIQRSSVAPDFRILHVGGGDLTLNGVTASGGRAAVGLEGDLGDGSGLGVEPSWGVGGKLRLVNSTIRENVGAGTHHTMVGAFSTTVYIDRRE